MYCKPKISPIGQPPMMKCISKPTPTQTPLINPQQQEDFFFRNIPQVNDPYSNNPFLNAQGDVTMSTTMPTDLINQMMNVNYQQKQRQFCQPSFNPLNPFNEPPNAGQNFYEKNLKFQQQQQLAYMKRDFNNSSGNFSTGSTSSSSMSAYEANLQQQYSMMTPTSSFYSNRYEPPKPDTPPSKPLWLDPVWNCDGNLFDNRNNMPNNNQGGYGNSDQMRRLNIDTQGFSHGSPQQMKGFNFHVVSPFMSFKTMFTFDNLGSNPNSNCN